MYNYYKITFEAGERLATSAHTFVQASAVPELNYEKFEEETLLNEWDEADTTGDNPAVAPPDFHHV